MKDTPTGFLCHRCMTWNHEPPKCSWNADTPCVACGRRVGFLGSEQERDGRCFACSEKAEEVAG